MIVTVRDEPAQNRFEIYDGDQLVGYAEYQISGDSLAFNHTYVLPTHTGRGLGGQLIHQALEAARGRALTVLPFCPFVRAVIVKDSDRFVDLVPERHRERFGISRQPATTKKLRQVDTAQDPALRDR